MRIRFLKPCDQTRTVVDVAKREFRDEVYHTFEPGQVSPGWSEQYCAQYIEAGLAEPLDDDPQEQLPENLTPEQAAEIIVASKVYWTSAMFYEAWKNLTDEERARYTASTHNVKLTDDGRGVDRAR